MPETKHKKNYWAGLIAVILIFGLPVGSYFYLKKGIDYRKDALSELEEQGTIQWANKMPTHALGERDSLSNRIVTMVSVHDMEDLKSKSFFIEKLHAQFGNRKEIKYVILTPESIHGSQFIFNNKLLDDLFLGSTADYALDSERIILFDGKGKIRGRYKYGVLEDSQRLVRHTAVLLPMEKRKTLKLIRKKKNDEAN